MNKHFWIGKLVLLLFLSLIMAERNGMAYTIVIDAGHGGKDPGAIGRREKEKNINLKVALRLGQLINQGFPSVKVIYTRKTDVFIPLDTRADIANRNKANLFISIHTNALPKGRIISGAETYSLGMARADENLEVAKRENSVILYESDYKERYAGFNPNSSESYIIFDFMQDEFMKQSAELAKAIQKRYKKAGRIDKGVHQAGFLVLRKTSMPSVLTELGFISTPNEEAYMISGTNEMANCIYQGFRDYYNSLRGVKQQEGEITRPEEPTVNEQFSETQEASASTHEAQETPASIVNEPSSPAIQEITPTVPEQTTQTTESGIKPVFKVQFYTSPRKLKDGSKEFKGIKKISFVKDGSTYKYMHGETSNYQEIIKAKKTVAAKFPDCFVVAFKGDNKISVSDAKNELNK